MKIDHIGYAVRDIGKAKKQLAALGYVFEDTIEDADRNVFLAFGELDGYRVELVAPRNRDLESPVDSVLAKNGPTPYHICYISNNLDADVETLQKNRFKITVSPAAAVAFNGKRVVFLYSLSAGLIELVEE